MTGPSIPEAVPKGFRRGTHRTVPPAETVERIRRLMPVLGITRVADVTGLDRIGIPVAMVVRPNARSLSVSQGKGLDMDAARASGLMEAGELYHAERITLPVKLASYNELRHTHPITDPELLPRTFHGAYHDSLTLPWIEGLNLLDQEPVWLPYELVSMNFTLPLPTGFGCFVGGSNGLASGNHPLEALTHALCEVIERDAATLFQASPTEIRDARRLDLSTVDDPLCLDLLDRFDRAQVAVGAWDATSDVGVPVFTCMIVDRSPDTLRRVSAAGGFGCHPSRGVALARALTEAAQSRLTLIAGSRDDLIREQYTEGIDTAALDELRGPGRADFRAVPHFEVDTFDEEVGGLLGLLRDAGFEQVLAVDLTQPGLEIPVVRVVVPGLEAAPHAEDYRPGARFRAVVEAYSDEDPADEEPADEEP